MSSPKHVHNNIKMTTLMPWLKRDGKHEDFSKGYCDLFEKFNDTQVFRYFEQRRLRQDYSTFLKFETKMHCFLNQTYPKTISVFEYKNPAGRCTECKKLNEIGNNYTICAVCTMKQDLAKQSSYYDRNFFDMNNLYC